MGAWTERNRHKVTPLVISESAAREVRLLIKGNCELDNFWTNLATEVGSVAFVLAVAGAVLAIFKDSIFSWLDRRASHYRAVELEKLKDILNQQKDSINFIMANVGETKSLRRQIMMQEQVEACRAVWKSTMAFSKFNMSFKLLEKVDLDEAIRRSEKGEKIPEFLEFIFPQGTDIPEEAAEANERRPFVPIEVWAAYSAYTHVAVITLMTVKFAMNRLPESLLNKNSTNMSEIIRRTLPYHADFVKEFGEHSGVYLYDALRENVLSKICQHLEGKDVDDAALEEARSIVELVKKSSSNLDEAGTAIKRREIGDAL